MTMTVLCVDDEPAVLTGLERHLRGRYTVITESDPLAAVELMRGRPRIDVVISDMRMPGMTGDQVLAAARELLPDARRILLTGHSDLDNVVASVNEGKIATFLTKPCTRAVLRRAVREAVEQKRFEDAFRVRMGRAGHEVDAMLAVLDSVVEQLGRDAGAKNPTDPELVQDLAVVTRYLRDEANRLRDEAHSGIHAERTTFDIGDVVAESLSLLRQRWDTDLVIDALPRGFHVHATRAELVEVLVNLMKNAIEAGAESVDVAVSHGPRGGLNLSVADDGVGLDPGDAERIFDRHFTSKSKGSCRGLGLWIARDVVQRHGGEISVFSGPAMGTTFTIWLPMVDASKAAAESASRPQLRLVKGR